MIKTDQEWHEFDIQQAVAKVRGKYRTEIGHEVNEAILSIKDREVPNIAMCLRRLARIQSILDKE